MELIKRDTPGGGGPDLKDLQLVISALPLGVSLYDSGLNPVFANREFLRIFGAPEGISAMKCGGPFNGNAEECPFSRALKSGRTEARECYHPASNRHLLIKVSPLGPNSRVTGLLCGVEDVTGMKTTKRDLEDLSAKLDAARDEIRNREKEIERSRDAFLNMLEDISESYDDLQELFMSLVKVMVNALDAKSPWTKGHSERVAGFAVKIADEMALGDDEKRNLRLAGLLHDIGKIGTYDYLLEKPAKLTDEEYDIVKKHPVQGAMILEGIKQLRDILPLIRYHHERMDGRGYPEGLSGEEIPLGARIMHVADSFDSMTADRPYRPAPAREYAISELKRCNGSQFDPGVVSAFLRVLQAEA